MVVPLDRIPPQSIEAEQATLGSMLISAAAIEKAAEVLRVEDFYRDAHRTIFDAILALVERDEAVDLLTLQDQLRMRNVLDSVGGMPYLVQLTEAVPTAANVEYYARLVEERAILRRLLDAAGQIQSLAHSDYDQISDVVDRAERLVFSVGQRRMGAYFTPMKPLIDSVFDHLERRSTNEALPVGLSTHIGGLNYYTAGLQPSDLIIVAARPSMGKTSLALGMAQHIALRGQQTVAVFSLEMSKEQLCLRMICSEALVDAHRLRTGRLRDEEWQRVGDACSRLAQARIFIDDTSECSALEMRAKCRRLQAEHGLGLILVDYLQLMRGHRRSENRVQEIGEIARALKSLAREMKVPVVALSQLSRAVEQRENKRPMLSDLRESGSIEAEADVVIFIYRPAYYEQRKGAEAVDSAAADRPPRGTEASEDAELIIAKQRNGPTGTVHAGFLSHYALFVEQERGRLER
ncbi:MAG TPA: replicative DNA helicase [Chthonomonadales bacterium]|nr:replicative DNA helicase [Chthonomonadales bacterium]